MAKYISNTSTTTQFLTNPTIDNPATVTSTGLIDVYSAVADTAAIFGPSGTAWTVANLGTVESVGSQGIGIDLLSGGLLINGVSGLAGGLVVGSLHGVLISGGRGTIANYGSIIGTGTADGVEFLSGGFLTKGVELLTGGSVANTGTISATGNGTGVFSSRQAAS
jgi:hypothetical protein